MQSQKIKSRVETKGNQGVTSKKYLATYMIEAIYKKSVL